MKKEHHRRQATLPTHAALIFDTCVGVIYKKKGDRMFSSGVLKVAALLLPLQAATAAAQMPWGRSFTDEGIGATYTIAIPEVPSAPFPLLMSISVPRDVSWAGFATGGCMLRSPLIVAWVNGTSLVVTTRWAP